MSITTPQTVYSFKHSLFYGNELKSENKNSIIKYFADNKIFFQNRFKFPLTFFIYNNEILFIIKDKIPLELLRMFEYFSVPNLLNGTIFIKNTHKSTFINNFNIEKILTFSEGIIYYLN